MTRYRRTHRANADQLTIHAALTEIAAARGQAQAAELNIYIAVDRALRAGVPATSIAEQMNLTRSAFYRWLRRHDHQNPTLNGT